MRGWTRPSGLAVVLLVDALLSIGFGVVSYFLPTSTYATIIDLSKVPEGSLMWAVLGNLSVFYVVKGALCLLAAFMQQPHDQSVAGSHNPFAIRDYQQHSNLEAPSKRVPCIGCSVTVEATRRARLHQQRRRPIRRRRLSPRETRRCFVPSCLRGCDRRQFYVTSFRPTMPLTMRPTQTRRTVVAGSLKRTMPRMAVPTVPMPVQTA